MEEKSQDNLELMLSPKESVQTSGLFGQATTFPETGLNSHSLLHLNSEFLAKLSTSLVAI